MKQEELENYNIYGNPKDKYKNLFRYDQPNKQFQLVNDKDRIMFDESTINIENLENMHTIYPELPSKRD